MRRVRVQDLRPVETVAKVPSVDKSTSNYTEHATTARITAHALEACTAHARILHLIEQVEGHSLRHGLIHTHLSRELGCNADASLSLKVRHCAFVNDT